MARPKTPLGADAGYLPTDTAQTIYDTDPASLPPLTRALRNAWGSGTNSAPYPMATSEAMAAVLAAVYSLETRVTALE